MVLDDGHGTGRKIQITLNGSAHTMAGPISVGELVRDLGLDASKVAVERNLEIVPQSVYNQAKIKNGDRLEIVQFIGGG